jgi:hypothetical protein
MPSRACRSRPAGGTLAPARPPASVCAGPPLAAGTPSGDAAPAGHPPPRPGYPAQFFLVTRPQYQRAARPDRFRKKLALLSRR